MYVDDGSTSGDAPGARPSGDRRCTMRVLRDSVGGMLVVYEADPVDAGGPRTLVFESGRGKKRLGHYPSDWRRLRDPELLALRRA